MYAIAWLIILHLCGFRAREPNCISLIQLYLSLITMSTISLYLLHPADPTVTLAAAAEVVQVETMVRQETLQRLKIGESDSMSGHATRLYVLIGFFFFIIIIRNMIM
jgi:hypothetical protein